MTATGLFEPGLVDRLESQYPSVDVRMLAANVRDMAKRKQVRNPDGLLVTWVRNAATPRATPLELNAELQHYAAFWVGLLRAIAVEQLSPVEIAQRIEAARADRYPKLNAHVAELLRTQGEW